MTNAMIGERVTGDDRTMLQTVHELKVWPEFFKLLWSGDKPFELRKDDRGFRAWDRLRLREYLPKGGYYTGREISTQLTCVVSGFPGLLPGYVILGLDLASARKTINPVEANLTEMPDCSEQTNTQAKP